MFGFSRSGSSFHCSNAARYALVVAVACGAASLGAQEPRAPAPPGDVIGVGNFAHIVANVDESLKFYHDVLGLEVTVTQGFAPNPAIEKLGHTEGGQSRIAVVKLPGIALGIELIEYKDIERKTQAPRFHDPGAANISLRVRNLDALFPKIASYPGVTVLTAGGKPATITLPNRDRPMKLVRGTDGHWRFDMLTYAGATTEQIGKQVAMYHELATAINALATDTRDGRFLSVSDLKAAIQDRVHGTIAKSMRKPRPTSGPTSAPTTGPTTAP